MLEQGLWVENKDGFALDDHSLGTRQRARAIRKDVQAQPSDGIYELHDSLRHPWLGDVVVRDEKVAYDSGSNDVQLACHEIEIREAFATTTAA